MRPACVAEGTEKRSTSRRMAAAESPQNSPKFHRHWQHRGRTLPHARAIWCSSHPPTRKQGCGGPNSQFPTRPIPKQISFCLKIARLVFSGTLPAGRHPAVCTGPPVRPPGPGQLVAAVVGTAQHGGHGAVFVAPCSWPCILDCTTPVICHKGSPSDGTGSPGTGNTMLDGIIRDSICWTAAARSFLTQ